MTLPEPYYNSQKISFANQSVLERWPIILTQVLDDVSKTIKKLDPTLKEYQSKVEEGKEIISQISQLLDEMKNDHELVPLKTPSTHHTSSDNLFSDIKDYNNSLEELKKESKGKETITTWHTAPWLYSECYMYRRLALIFQATKEWTFFDYFADSKSSAFSSSKDGVIELALRYKDLSQQLAEAIEPSSSEDKNIILEELFNEFVDISLWGNATDLSLLTTISLEDIKKLQGAEVRRANEANILVNDTKQAWEAVAKPVSQKAQTEEQEKNRKRVDIVLDNAGFELYTDLVFSLFLLDSKLVNSVVLHPKSIPWFVSDVMPHDVGLIIRDLKNPTFFGGKELQSKERIALDYLAMKLESYYKPDTQEVQDGGIFVHTSLFWTTEFPFNSDLTPEGRGGGDKAWEDLIDSSLVVFKGDLNHRKLIGDLQWDRTTPFSAAVGLEGLVTETGKKQTLANSGIKFLTLRTVKADTLTGLSAGTEEKLNELWWQKQGQKGDKDIVERGWAYCGKWAVIEYSNGDYNI